MAAQPCMVWILIKKKHKNTGQCGSFDRYLQHYSANKKSAGEYLNDYIKNTQVVPKLLMYDTFLLMCKSNMNGLRT